MTWSRIIHSVGVSSIVLAVIVLTAGCGKKESPVASAPAQGGQPAPQAPPPAPARTAEPTPAPGGGVTPPAATPAPTPAGGQSTSPWEKPAAVPPATAAAAAPSLGVQDHEVNGIQVALLEVKRTSGDTVTVKWQYRNTASEKKYVAEVYGHRAAEGAYLIDAVNKKKYLVVRDAGNTPVSSDGRSDHIDPRATVTSWAKFPAPPADVTKITVNVKGVPPFEDVPVGQ